MEALTKADFEKRAKQIATKKDLKAVKTELKADIARLDKKVDGLDKKVDGLDKKVDGLDKKVDGLGVRLEELIDHVKKVAEGHSSLRTRMDSTDKANAAHFTHHEQRIDTIDAQIFDWRQRGVVP